MKSMMIVLCGLVFLDLAVQAETMKISGTYDVEMKIGNRVFRDLMNLTDPDSSGKVQGDFTVPGVFSAKITGAIDDSLSHAGPVLSLTFDAVEAGNPFQVQLFAMFADFKNGALIDGRRVLSGSAYKRPSNELFGHFRAMPVLPSDELEKLGIATVNLPILRNDGILYEMRGDRSESLKSDFLLVNYFDQIRFNFNFEANGVDPGIHSSRSHGRCYYVFRPDVNTLCSFQSEVIENGQLQKVIYEIEANQFTQIPKFERATKRRLSGETISAIEFYPMYTVPEMRN